MEMPDDAIASLVNLAEQILTARDGGEVINPEAVKLAESVIEHGKAALEPAPPPSFSFAMDTDDDKPKNA